MTRPASPVDRDQMADALSVLARAFLIQSESAAHMHKWTEKWRDGSIVGQECECGAERDAPLSASAARESRFDRDEVIKELTHLLESWGNNQIYMDARETVYKARSLLQYPRSSIVCSMGGGCAHSIKCKSQGHCEYAPQSASEALEWKQVSDDAHGLTVDGGFTIPSNVTHLLAFRGNVPYVLIIPPCALTDRRAENK